MDQVHVSVGGRIEGAGIEGFNGHKNGSMRILAVFSVAYNREAGRRLFLLPGYSLTLPVMLASVQWMQHDARAASWLQA
jgi:hypothetical protein